MNQIYNILDKKSFKEGKLGFGYNPMKEKYFSIKTLEESTKDNRQKFDNSYSSFFQDLNLKQEDLNIDNFDQNSSIIKILDNFMTKYNNVNQDNFTYELGRVFTIGTSMLVNLLFEVIAVDVAHNPFKDKKEFIEFMQYKWKDDYRYTNLCSSNYDKVEQFRKNFKRYEEKFKNDKYYNALKEAAKIINYAHFFNMDNNRHYKENYCNIKELSIYGQQLITLNREPTIVYRGMRMTDRSKAMDANYFFDENKNRGIHDFLINEYRMNLPKVNDSFEGIQSVHNVVSTTNKFSYALQFGEMIFIILKDKSISTDDYDRVPNYQFEEAMFSIDNENILAIIEMKKPEWPYSMNSYLQESSLKVNPKNKDFFLKLKEHIGSKSNHGSQHATRFEFNNKVINYDAQIVQIINVFNKNIDQNNLEYQSNIEYKPSICLGNASFYESYYERAVNFLDKKEQSSIVQKKLKQERAILQETIITQLQSFIREFQ